MGTVRWNWIEFAVATVEIIAIYNSGNHSCSNPSKLNYYLATEDASGRELGMVMLASQMGLYRSI